MVNTRRTESIGSATDNVTRLRSRGRADIDDRDGSSSITESEDSTREENSWNAGNQSSTRTKEELPSKLRSEPRSRFSELAQYSSRLRSHTHLDDAHKRLPLRQRRTIEIYKTHKMEESDSCNENETEEEMFSSRGRRRRHVQRLSRFERRTALSLRPIRQQKSYADSFNEESEVGRVVRRSKRKRKVQFGSGSWLDDDQVHKVGYPNLNTTGYSEEDSRDAQEVHTNSIEEVRRITRLSNGITSNKRRMESSKYLYEYESSSIPTRRPRSVPVLTEHTERELRSQRTSNDKEHKEENIVLNQRSKIPQNDRDMVDMKESGEACNMNNIDKSEDSNQIKTDENQEIKTNSKDTNSSDSDEASPRLRTRASTSNLLKNNINKDTNSSSDEAPRLRTRTRSANNLMNRRFPIRETRNRKGSSSSESDREVREERKSYSLRVRPPKPDPNSRTVIRSHEITRRRRFTRLRQAAASSSDSSSDNNVYSKTPKSPHSKNDQRMKSGAGGNKIIPIGPETLDTNVRFNSIGGLDSHIQCLKEMILLPMMYPEVFQQFQIQPPRGVLFHGPPGTGKTLIARALANECSFGSRKVSFFMRKGADLLSKWIGESEKHLRLLFEQAAARKPSIIFFDELDGLAPVRSSRQDQVHASIVSTLLALMDGLDNRGEVIVIGATNRIDAIDPALRRPGRFDRELYFSLPTKKEREEILNVHVSKWTKPPNNQLLSHLADQAVGYCGSDLRALCTEAVIQSFRRTYPQVYNSEHRLLLQPENVMVNKLDFMRAKSMLVPASQRINQTLGRRLLKILEPLYDEFLDQIVLYLQKIFPHGLNETLAKVKLTPNVRPAQLLLTGDGSEYGQTVHLAPAILYKMEHIQCYILDLSTLYRESGRSPEEVTIQVFTEAQKNVPSVIYLPNIDKWWELVSDTIKTILTTQLSQLEAHVPILFLATANSPYSKLAPEIQNIFSKYRKEVFHITPPNSDQRKAFFKPLLLETTFNSPRMCRRKPRTPPPLPRAPTPPEPLFTEEQKKKMYAQEEHILRELRMFLRDMCRKLASNKLYYIFTKPVDTEEVPDYTNIIKQPMDLETIMTKVDFHRYDCARDFLMDIELICKNALEYNPAKNSVDRQIRHRACSLRDYAYALIKREMDTDFEDQCQEIAKRRTARKDNSKSLPDYINTPDDKFIYKSDGEKAATVQTPKSENINHKNGLHPRKRKVNNNWQRGFLRKRKKKIIVNTSKEENNEEKMSTEDESKENKPTVDSPQSETSKDSNEKRETTPVRSTSADVNKGGSSALTQSPKPKICDILSPSELLDDSLEFDDVDQAMNELDGSPTINKEIECPRQELESLLDNVVKVTSGCTVQSLLDLYYQLNSIIKKYLKTHIRTAMPKELVKELGRFKKGEPETPVKRDGPSEASSCKTP